MMPPGREAIQRPYDTEDVVLVFEEMVGDDHLEVVLGKAPARRIIEIHAETCVLPE